MSDLDVPKSWGSCSESTDYTAFTLSVIQYNQNISSEEQPEPVEKQCWRAPFWNHRGEAEHLATQFDFMVPGDQSETLATHLQCGLWATVQEV